MLLIPSLNYSYIDYCKEKFHNGIESIKKYFLKKFYVQFIIFVKNEVHKCFSKVKVSDSTKKYHKKSKYKN